MKPLKVYMAIVFALFSCGVFAQKNADSAAIVINNYLGRLNHETLNWKTAKVNSIITNNIDSDTIIMERRFAFPNYSFVTLTRKGSVIEGLFSNGKEYLQYDAKAKAWVVLPKERYEKIIEGYDIRGPLFNWENRYVKATYLGISTFEGNKVFVLTVFDPERNPRNYLFECLSGNLFLIVEQPLEKQNSDSPAVDWRAIHEYIPLGTYLFPALESYQSGNTITVIRSQIEILPFDEKDYKRP